MSIHKKLLENIPTSATAQLKSKGTIKAKQRPVKAAHQPVKAKHQPIKAKHTPVQRKKKPKKATTITQTNSEQKASTWGGEWKTKNYAATKNYVQGEKKLTSFYYRGAKIALEFKPNSWVDADLIGMVQSVQSIEQGKTFNDSIPTDQKISSQDANKSTWSDNDVDTHIDQLNLTTDELAQQTGKAKGQRYRNPLYAINKVKKGDKKLTDTMPSDQKKAEKDIYWGRHGYRKSKKGKTQVQSAILKDEPALPYAKYNSKQVFETTALAISGKQKNMYYGSVRWGWYTDQAGKQHLMPLKVVSNKVPSSSFFKAAELWNNSQAKDTIDLPLENVQLTTEAMTLHNPDTIPQKVTIPKGTRVKVKLLRQQVEVADGEHAGFVGTASVQALQSIVDERK